MNPPSLSPQHQQILSRDPLPRTPRNLEDRNPAAARVFSTAAYDPREQFDVWRSRVSSLWDARLAAGASVTAGFHAEYMTCNLGGIVISSGRFAAHRLARSSGHAHRSLVDHWWLVRARSGEAWFETGERRLHARPGDIFLISLDQDFRGCTTDYDALTLILPRDDFRPVAASLDSACNTILSGNLAGLLADHLDSLETRLVGMSPEELVEAGRATAGVIAACVRPSGDQSHEANAAIEALLFERAQSYIQLNLSNHDLTPDQLAQVLGVSRSNLYRAFERVGGIFRYIQHCRLAAARAALSAGDRRQIKDIAYRHGFRTASGFAKAFRREFGYSPGEARESSRDEPGIDSV
jgi:AraC-like DNA-binding protein